MSATGGDRVWTSAEWVAYFQANQDGLSPLLWEEGVVLSGPEKAAITRSVAEFQLGESSEGRHFLGRARSYAVRTGDVDYPQAAALFIAEEHRHARDLGRVMDLAGIPRLQQSWTDSVFRGLRRSLGLEVSISVLITAEILAQVYYEALRQATRSAVLRTLCDRILQDEAEHVRFQAERLAILRAGRPRVFLRAIRAMHRGFFAATCLVVWKGHGRAFRRGGYGFRRFLGESEKCLEGALNRMDPARYAEIEQGSPLVPLTS